MLMTDTKSENKTTSAYSLEPHLIAWVRQKALSLSTPDKIISGSQVVNDILKAAMESESREEDGEKLLHAVQNKAQGKQHRPRAK